MFIPNDIIFLGIASVLFVREIKVIFSIHPVFPMHAVIIAVETRVA